MSSRDRSKEPSKESSKERRKAIPKGKKPKASEATSSSSAAATVSPTEAHVASSANIKSVLSKNLEAYEDVREEDLNAVLAAFANMDHLLPSSSSAAASVRPIKTFQEGVKSLAEMSKESASLSAAATRSPSPEHFAKIMASLNASTALAADLTLIASIKAQLKSESKLGRMILGELEAYPVNVRCQYIKMFLSDLYATLEEPASTSLHKYIIGPKALPCTTKITEKQFLAYLIDIIGLPPAVGEKARGILFNTDLFNRSTIKENLYGNSIPHLIDYYHLRWVQFRKTKGGSRSKKRMNRRLNRRLNRTRKI
jgi:hypothetical protein